MLRELHRVLKPGGRIAGYVIHTPPGLNARAERRAADLGLSELASPAPTEEMVASAGLALTAQKDVTDSFHETCKAILEVRERLADKLRAEEGGDFYEEEQKKKAAMVMGVDEGLLVRSLFLIEEIILPKVLNLRKGGIRRI